MRKDDYAKEIILIYCHVNSGRLKIFLKTIVDNIEGFNKKFETNFNSESSSYDIVEFIRNTFNSHAKYDFSDGKYNTKEWFNCQFCSYACVVM